MICHREEIRFVIQMSYFIEHSHLKLYFCETPEVSERWNSSANTALRTFYSYV